MHGDNSAQPALIHHLHMTAPDEQDNIQGYTRIIDRVCGDTWPCPYCKFSLWRPMDSLLLPQARNRKALARVGGLYDRW